MLDPKTAPLHIPLRLICTDFDGTIAEADPHAPIPSGFFDRLNAWRKAGTCYWIINTGRTFESLNEELLRRKAPYWPDWAVTVEREIWLVRDRRPIGWFEWNRKCELLHKQLFASVQPIWKRMTDYLESETQAEMVDDVGSPLGIIAASEAEADRISEYLVLLLKDWPSLVPVRNSIYFRFSHRLYNKGTCLEAIMHGLGVQPYETLVVGDHLNDLPMLSRRYARFLACPGNSVKLVKARVMEEEGYVAQAENGAGTLEAWDATFPAPNPAEQGK